MAHAQRVRDRRGLGEPAPDARRPLGDQLDDLVEIDDGQARGVEDQRDRSPCAAIGLEYRRGHRRELGLEFADGNVVACLADRRIALAEFAPVGGQAAANDLVVARVEDLATYRQSIPEATGAIQ